QGIQSNGPAISESAIVYAADGGRASSAIDRAESLPGRRTANATHVANQAERPRVSLDQGGQVQAQKKIKQTDAIFAKLKEVNKAADEAATVLRLSWDAKATVKLGDFSRGGQNRLARKAADHDFQPDGILNPFGILLPRWDDLTLYFTPSPVTSDFIVDMLGRW